MKNKLFSVGVEAENRKSRGHSFSVSLEFCDPIHENDAKNWLQKVISDAAATEFVVEESRQDEFTDEQMLGYTE